MTHGEIEEIREVIPRLRAFGLDAPALRVETLILEALRLRQGLWDVAKVCGADTDGNDTPQPFMGDVVAFAKQTAGDLRECYDEALRGEA